MHRDSNNPTLEPTAIYARVSDPKQVERETIDGQLYDLRAYADQHGFREAGLFTDKAVSGVYEFWDRPGGRALIEAAERGEFTTVLAVDIDRLGRGDKFSGLRTRWFLRDLGLKTILVDQEHISDDDDGDLYAAFESWRAQKEIKKFAKRVKRGSERNARAGKFLGGTPPLGYRIEDGKYVVDERSIEGTTPAAIVRTIFSLSVEQGMTTRAIADELNRRKIPTSDILRLRLRLDELNATPTGRPAPADDDEDVVKERERIEDKLSKCSGIWRNGRIGSLLRNSTYRGKHTWGKVHVGKFKHHPDLVPDTIERTIPAIIGDDVWNVAQDRLDGNIKFAARNNSVRPYLLRSLISCGACGQNFIGGHYATKTMGTRAYYRCNGCLNPANGTPCTAPRLDADWLEAAVWNDIVDWVHHPGRAIEDLAAYYADRGDRQASLQERIAETERKLDRLIKQHEKLLDLFMDDIIDKGTLDQRLSKLDSERDDLASMLLALEREADAETFDPSSVEALLDELRPIIADPLSVEMKQYVIRHLIDSIEADDGSVEVTYKFTPQAAVSIVNAKDRHRGHPSRSPGSGRSGARRSHSGASHPRPPG